MVRDLFAGFDAEDQAIAGRWLMLMKLGRLQSVKLTMAEFEALWAATDEPNKAPRVH